MKKSLLAVLFAVALVVPAVAENMWIGGSLGYESSSLKTTGGSNDVDANMFSIEPEFGYSVNEKWDIGIDLAYSTGKGTVDEMYGIKAGENKNPTKLDKWGIAPFARYHVAKIGDFDVMLKGALFYEKIDAENNDGADKSKISGYGIAIAPVISYSINETWSIGCTLNFLELAYAHYSDDDNSDNKIDNFGFNVNDGSIMSVGFSYHF